MSLDLDLVQPGCEHCGRDGESVADFNYTYNVSPVWYEIFPDHENMIPVDNMTGEESLPMLYKAVGALEKDPNKFRPLVRGNGTWGTVEGFLAFLRRLIVKAEKYPNAVWRAGR